MKMHTKTVVVLIGKIIFLHNILIFKTCYLHLDTCSNIYLDELLVGHRASISSVSFSIICAAVTFQRVKSVPR